MSETTEILFNSPALRSLRRDQLQRLCKLHSIRANGKNTELVERLKLRALTLPKDDPLSIAARSEQDNDSINSENSDTNQNPRPSEQWEVVMEDIQEMEEAASSQASAVSSSIRAIATSLGLTRANKSSTELPSVSSKTSAEMDQDELTQHSIPYSATQPATPPLQDNFTFDPTTASHTRMSYDASGEPLPGCSLRPGEPAPDNARLSLGDGQGQQPSTPKKEQAQPTTTIRLVSRSEANDNLKPVSRSDAFKTPSLKPFATTFDLVMSPSTHGGDGGAFWAPDTRPGQVQSIYPTLTIDDLPPDIPPSPIKIGDNKVTNTNSSKPDTLTVPTATTSTTNNARAISPDPFIFGSPRHSVSNTEFRTAATSVLEEMNKRLLNSGVEGVGMDIVNKLQPGGYKQAQLRETKPLPSRLTPGAARGGEIKRKFDERHRAEFDKMEGIDGVVKRRAAAERKTSTSASMTKAPTTTAPLAVGSLVGKKRKSNVLGALGDGNGKPRRPTTTPSFGPDFGSIGKGRTTSRATGAISNGPGGMTLPGGFADEEEEVSNVEAEGPRDAPIQEAEEQGAEEGGGRGGKRARLDPDTDPDATKAKGKGKAKAKYEDVMDVDNEDHEAQNDNSEDEEQEKKNWRKSKELDREREVIKRKLEMSRAKRRSSVGGAVAAATKSATVAAARRRSSKPPVTPKTKSRFGFLSSARKLVASVWNRGRTPATAASKQATITVTAPTPGVEAPTKSSLLKRKVATPGFAPARAFSVTATNTSNNKTTTMAQDNDSGTANGQLSVGQSQDKKGSATGTTRSRSPIPPFNVGGGGNKPGSVSSRTTGVVRTSTVQAAGGGNKASRISSSSSGSRVGSMGAKTTIVKPKTNSLVSSRLLAPTASSLAKMRTSSPATTSSSSPHTSAIGQQKKASLLGPITNSPKVQGGIPRRGLGSVVSPLSGSRKAFGAGILSPKMSGSGGAPRPTRIFSKPVTVNGVSGIPVKSLSKKTNVAGPSGSGTAVEGEGEDVEMSDAATGSADTEIQQPKTPGTITRQRTFTRKPRISRSKVIAKLASQRAASVSSPFKPRPGLNALPSTPLAIPGAVATPRASGVKTQKRVRSSFAPVRHGRGASFGVSSSSSGGVGRGSERERMVLASAKKRVRQSEYARRRSRVSGVGIGPGIGGDD